MFSGKAAPFLRLTSIGNGDNPAPGRLLVLLLVLAMIPIPGLPADTGRELVDLSLEELANIRVTSVSKKSEPLADAAASIFVITGEDIRRSGATTLPEALRLAPNLQVARVDARNYAITARGFNNPFENKLLVLIDGRTVYSPLFSGVFWDAQDVVLEDVERIEVISGPGATLWGANAVNGVINVITKSAGQTQGALVAAGASRNEKNGVLRYGGALDNGGYYRVYGKYADNDDTPQSAGVSTDTGWHREQAGFRTDWSGRGRRVTFQGDAYHGDLHQFGTTDIGIAGANLLGRMTTRLDTNADMSVQAYWDYTERNQPGAYLDHLNTVDLEVQRSNKLAIQNIVWGAGYRLASDHIQNDQSFAFLPGSFDMHWGNVFVQDEVALRDDLHLTGGMKLESNNYTGLEYLPTIRLAWKPTANRLVWTALSRSVRAPSRIDRDFFSPTNPPIINGTPQYFVAGGPAFESETANVLEVGYRAQPTSTLSFSATAFYSRFDDLRTLELNTSGPGVVFKNGGQGTTRGVESWGTWQALPSWRLSAGLVVQRIDTSLAPGVVDLSSATGLATSDPTHYWTFRSSYDIAQHQELDLMVRHSGSLAAPSVPAYTAVDLRYGWKLRPGLELSLVGQNLLDSEHTEFGAAPGGSVFDRALFVKLVWSH